jgi:hypothetical protein
LYFAKTRSGSPTAATIHIKPAGLEIEGLPHCRASGHKDGCVLSGDTSSSPHLPPMSMPSQTPEVSVGSARNRDRQYLQLVSKQTLVKNEMEITSK